MISYSRARLRALLFPLASLAVFACDGRGCAADPPPAAGALEVAQPQPEPEPEPGPPPNVLVVLVDTTRADHLHFMGYERDTSPHLDAFAARSTVYEQHHSHSSRTGPSVASIFTGRYPGAHGVLNPLTHFDAKGKLGDAQVTLAERLRDAGFATYGVVTNPNASGRFGFGQGFDVYELRADTDLGRGVNKRAFALLDAHAAHAAHEPGPRPFFMYLHYMGPHSPYWAAPARAKLFALPDYHGPINGAHGQLDKIVAGRLKPSARDIDQLTRLYDQDIRSFDDAFGELMAGLRERKLDEDTLVVFVADHGEELWDHGSVLHGYTLYEEVLHVPFVVHDPREEMPSARVAVPTGHVDILPMLLRALSLPPEPAAQGRSEVSADSETEIFAHVQLRAVKTVKLRALQLGDWKLIENELPRRSTELFQLAEDPRERDSRAASEPKRVAAMVEAMRRVERANAGGDPLPEDLLTLTTDELAQLRALGYVGPADEVEPSSAGGHDGDGASP